MVWSWAIVISITVKKQDLTQQLDPEALISKTKPDL
jgi:hypothetical protein